MLNKQRLINTFIENLFTKNESIKAINNKIIKETGQLLLIGGIIRDLLILINSKSLKNYSLSQLKNKFNKLNTDLDFEVYGIEFEKLRQILSEFGSVNFVGKSFGVLRCGRIDADWSLPRADSAGRKPIVSLNPNMDFKSAFSRRDITINSIGLNLATGKIIDEFSGETDIKNKIIRATNLNFFAEDPLRVLRVMQLSARLNFKVATDLLNLCKKINLSNLSVSRINAEFEKLFYKGIKISNGIKFLIAINQFKNFFPSIKNLTATNLKKIDAINKIKFTTNLEKLCIAYTTIFSHSTYIQNFKVNTLKQLKSTLFKPLEKELESIITNKSLITQIAAFCFYLKVAKKIIATKKNNSENYKFLSFWLEKYSSLKFFSIAIKSCFNETIYKKFIKTAKKNKVFLSPEKALVTATDLLHKFQSVELGEQLKTAYKLQIKNNIKNKSELLKLLNIN